MRLLLAGLFSFLAATASAGPATYPPDSREVFAVVLTDGDTIRAVAVQPRSFDVVWINTEAGAVRTVATNRLEHVFDNLGRDRLNDILRWRKSVGKPYPPKPPSFGPRDVTKSFGLTETSLSWTVAGEVFKERRSQGTIDFGAIENMGDRTAIGWSVFLGGGPGFADVGARLRFRYWLGRQSSLEVAPGFSIQPEFDLSTVGRSPSYVLRVTWHANRWFGLTAQGHTRDQLIYDGGWRREVGLMAGVKLGATPGFLIGIPVLASAVHGTHRGDVRR